jgi:signal transduction histidine kinase/DNA-binding response OmpR family regulator
MERQSKVLVVDDDPFALRSMARALGGESYQVVTAASGSGAIDLLKQDSFDLVLTDLKMPEVDGLAVLREAREIAPRAVVLILTGYASLESAIEALRKGAYDYLVKPCADDELKLKIARGLERVRLAEERQHAEEMLRRAHDELEERVQERTAELAKANEALQAEITARKQVDGEFKELLKKIERAKQEWESTADSLPDLVCLVDHRGRIMRANRTVETWNLARVVDVKGRGVHELLHPGCADSSCYLNAFWKGAWEGALRGQPAQCEAYDQFLKRYVLVQLQPWKDWGKGTALGSTVVVVRDITERMRAEERVQHLLDQQIAVNRLVLALGESRDIDEMYYTIYVHVRALMDADVFILSFYDHETRLLRAGYVVSEGTVRDAANLPPVPLEEVGHGTQSQVVHTGEPFYVHDLGRAMETTRTGYTILKDGTAVEGPPPPEYKDVSRSSLCVPMKIEGETIGVMQVQSYRLDAYSQEDIDLLSGLANVAVIAIENARLFEQVRAGRERLRRLTQQVVSAQEEERRRLSRELHDEAGQALTALKISLDLIQSDLPVEAGSLRQRLGEAGALTETTMEQIRLLAYGLRPPALDAVGLSYTLEGLCRDFAERTQLPIDYAGAELPVLPEAVNMCLYRVLQEALTNVAKHADANQVRAALCCDAETVSLAVEDDGQGFEVQAGTSVGIGLLGMQERIELLGGQLEIESWPGQGTRLMAHIPLQKAYLDRRRGGDSRHRR